MLTIAESHLLSSVNSTNASDQLSQSGSVPDNAQSKTKDKDTDISVNSDDHDVELYSKLSAANKQIIQEKIKFLLHEQTTVELQSEDSHLITPHPSRQQLPNELVSRVIEYLPSDQNTLYQCTLVSWWFYSIANPLLWKAPVLKESSVSERFLGCLLDTSLRRRSTTIGQLLRDLRLQGQNWTDDQLIRLLPHIPRLEHMAINGPTRITDTSFQLLPHYCESLTSLSVESRPQLSFANFDLCFRKLVEFKWTNAHDSLSKTQLQWLRYGTLEHLHISAYNPLRQKALNVIKDLVCLKSLRLLGNNSHMNFLLQGFPMQNNNRTLWPQLTNLSIGTCRDLKDTTLMTFLHSHPHLQELELSQATELTDVSLDAMAGFLPHLTHLTLTYNSNITPNAVQGLVRQCRALVYADFLYCNRLVSILFYYNTKKLNQEELDKIRQEATE